MYLGNETGSIGAGSQYRDAFLELHGSGRMTVQESGPWAGRLDWQRSSRYGIALCGGVQEEFVRGRRDIRTAPRGTFELLMPIAGAARVEQGSASGEIGPGTLALCEIDRPVGLAHGLDFTSIAVIVPAEEIERRSPAAARRPPAVNGFSGVGRLIRQMITTLHEERRQLTETSFDFAADQLLDMVLFAADGAADTAPAGQRARVEAEVRQYIRRHAQEPDLNIVSVARALGWSARYLQDVLNAADTTARDLIRSERLLLARSRLTSPGWSEHSIARIAHACGFTSQASFATAYRREFGLAPREARRSARQT
ncbi:helix-turn-helix transcriptional regulator [Kineosporia succinea]|uniref:AraC-like DNA-binding protein n=1 Tax=Kineosporia succinea TaxID=84632 RepID=A0ABT9PCQ9_9ACTN|nr:AraC family transcriptional regulator [Kineosporia succinea]MDP9830501.1 AraC-like DNA-binding protein [Kineosporia succinea]